MFDIFLPIFVVVVVIIVKLLSWEEQSEYINIKKVEILQQL